MSFSCEKKRLKTRTLASVEGHKFCVTLLYLLNSPSNKIQKYERASSFIFVFGQHRQLTIVFVILQENQSLSLARIEVHTHIRTYARCVCNGSRKRLDEPLKFQRISSDLVYCGNPSSKTNSRKKSLHTYTRTYVRKVRVQWIK